MDRLDRQYSHHLESEGTDETAEGADDAMLDTDETMTETSE